MGHHAIEFDVVKLSERARKLREFARLNAEPPHPGVNLEMEVDGLPQRSGARIQLFGLIEAVDRHIQIVRDQIIRLSAPEPAQAKDRTGDSRAAQFNSLFDERHAEPV